MIIAKYLLHLHKMRLSKYAKHLGITYRTAWNNFKDGKIIGAYKLPSGSIIVPDKVEQKKECVAVYARVSSSENKKNLVAQSKRVQDFCAAKGWVVKKVEEECASGLNDKRPKLLKWQLYPFTRKVS